MGRNGWSRFANALKVAWSFWESETHERFIMRLIVPNGILKSNQLKVIASIVARYGKDGSADITTN